MPVLPHTAIYTDNRSGKEALCRELLQGTPPPELRFLEGRRGELFSNARVASLLEEEARHGRAGLNTPADRELATLSSGERKKALLKHLLSTSPDFLIADNPLDHLDRNYQQELLELLENLSAQTLVIQFLSRQGDLFPFIHQYAFLNGSKLEGFPDYQPQPAPIAPGGPFQGSLPPAPERAPCPKGPLVAFRNVHLSYSGKPVLRALTWTIEPGDFWELRGPNGSGKTSLITLINGDNPKAYGQEIDLFGRRKGSGESVWEIKERIGYFTPAMTDRFRGYHTLDHMLISGLTDSVGLYIQPTDAQRSLAMAWLRLLQLDAGKDALFNDLTEGQQRLLMCARAMIKHPALLILDEPTAGLDDDSAALVVALIRKMATESETAIVFVSHREEPGLQAERILELHPGPEGSTGIVIHHKKAGERGRQTGH
ncbi:ATP-binding cassette domain-containing protein [Robiginitalea marina]|uniref:ATP-binding cassette domain-containing protein n=1 Tax=Robiginitalea marina TaxID=2954105 RepID=A0ABT1B1Y5_9FLAO|nr:ATP-binding cassette domain-containing protein [Robiginitalea marina]MCO5725907.1 ATP-binding cassette domain-containing protein [Robiginitalea marina]